MIKEIFLPEKTKTRRIISKRIVGISIQENIVSAAQIYATPSSYLVEKFFKEEILPGAPDRYDFRASEAVKKILKKFSKNKEIRISIESNIVTFKELTLPFIDVEKIKMVVEYEVESLLPFSINESVVDFIITKQDKEKKRSQILVAAVRNKDLKNIFEIYKMAGVSPDYINVDLFSLYGIYKQIPDYKDLKGANAIVDIGEIFSSVAFILNGEIRLIRNISKGIRTVAHHVSEDTKKPVEEIMSSIMTFGLEKPNDLEFSQTIKKYTSTFLNDIQFTLNSFSLKMGFYEEINKIIITGKGSLVKGLIDFSKTFFKTSCEKFSCDKLFKTKSFKNKTKQFINNWEGGPIALGTAVPFPGQHEFNLRKKEFSKKHFPLITKQLFTAATLVLIIFGTISTRGFMQIQKLQNSKAKKKKAAIKKLKKIFPPKHAALKKTKLKPLIKAAKNEINTRKEAWKPFMQENLMPLQILKDLTQNMDRRSFNISIERININLDEQGVPQVDVLGLFKSQPGKHFSDYGNFVKFFEQNSSILALKDEDGDIADEGVRFSFNLKRKEKEQ